ncbi:MAG: hypothetical protein LAP21_17810 [Acidobacteriia bacterium]|nr:hypothetical protein [Terriglobia bacterium]
MIGNGPVLAEGGPNKILICILALLAAGAAYGAWSIHSPEYHVGEISLIAALAILAGLVFWFSRIRVALFSDGLHYRNLLGEKEMSWEEVDQFYYEATAHSIHIVIPLGTTYSFKLVDSLGRTVKFGSDVSGAGKIAPILIERTREHLYKKMAGIFASGSDVDCGWIRVNRDTGLSIRNSWGGRKQTAWDEVESFAIGSGRFHIRHRGNKIRINVGTPLGKVSNAFALFQLLKAILRVDTQEVDPTAPPPSPPSSESKYQSS